jgi:hypothetical protein
MPHNLVQTCVAEQSNDRVHSKRQAKEKLAKHFETTSLETEKLNSSSLRPGFVTIAQWQSQCKCNQLAIETLRHHDKEHIDHAPSLTLLTGAKAFIRRKGEVFQRLKRRMSDTLHTLPV